MTDLPAPVPRQQIHTRQVTTHGYLRDDGLWDIEGELADTKSYFYRNPDGLERPPGNPVHHMKIRLTMNESMTVQVAVSCMPSTPFPECQGAAEPVGGMVGVTVGAGWRKAIDKAMGDIRGCTHLRELLAAMGTVAIQTIPNYRAQQQRLRGETVWQSDQPGHQMGKCLGWDFNGAVIARVAPAFIGWIKPLPALTQLPDQAPASAVLTSPNLPSESR